MIIRILCLLPVFLLAQPGLAQERTIPENQQQVQLSFAPLVKKVAPAVVNIYTRRIIAQRSAHPFFDDPFFGPLFQDEYFGGRMRQQVESALGSGVIIEPDGLVVTSSHVVGGAEEITIGLDDGREFNAKIALVDERSDLALLRVDTEGEELPYVNLRPSETLEVGDLVLAIGNPFGVGQTVTSGIVSATGRSNLDITDFNFFIQTDAAINPGNSGGPLVALDGGVVGINSAIFSRSGGNLGIGFAIPSEMVASVIAAEKAGTDTVLRPWLGVSAQNVTADIAQGLNMDRPAGVLVSALHQASPLRGAGVRVGDVILSLDGKPLRDAQELKFRMATVPLGRQAAMEIFRSGRTENVEIKAIAPPDEPPRHATALEGNHPLHGATIANLNPAVAFELDLGPEYEEGVVVLNAPPRGYFGQIARAGDIIREINGKPVQTVRDALEALKNPSNQGWHFVINSQGRTRQLLVR